MDRDIEVGQSRGRGVPQGVLGNYNGNVTSDSWGAWNSVGSSHQRCHWHYLNDLKDILQYKNPGPRV